MGGPSDLTIPSRPSIPPKQDTKYDKPLGKIWEEEIIGARRKRPMNKMEGQEKL